MKSQFSLRREAAVASQFYPGDANRLLAEVERYTGGKPPVLPAAVRALIVPHAGYPYSGATAGQAYALLRGRADIARVVVVAPSHRVAFRGLSLGNYGALCTPLGELPVDTAACAALAEAHPLLSCRTDAHVSEHALEVQLPFLQVVLPQRPAVVPLVCGELTPAELRELARALAPVLWNPHTLWVISSDFTHFGEAFGYVPFTRDVPRRLEELDTGAIDLIRRFDLDGFSDYIERTGATICGSTPIGLLLALIEPERERLAARLLAYTTSGSLTHDWEHSVSYAALCVFDAATSGDEAAAPAGAAASHAGCALGADERALLLRLAREAIGAGLTRKATAPPAAATLPEELTRDGAAFVTLHLDGNLRGCIGSLEADEPLYRNVMRNARNAAFHDPRFFPLTAQELPRVRLEISVLTPPRRIASPAEFVIGRHGIILEKDGASAVFLPQVAPEQGWDRDTTLTHLALKAGLEPNAWRRDAEFFVFEAIVFGEE